MANADTAAEPHGNEGHLKPGDHIYLVDGSGYIFRAYHALPPLSRKSDGLQVNAVSGFCNMLYKLLEDLREGDRPSHLAVIMDAGRRTFRNDIYPDYKAHRPPPPEDLIPQFDIIRDAVSAFNLPCISTEGFEADDLIATYARQAEARGAKVTIVSSDKDLMQLVDDQIEMLDPMKSRTINHDQVMEKFGVGPDRVIDVQALAGDSSDNVPGVPGIGIKTAALLINEYGDLDSLLARAGEIKQNKRRENLLEFADQARISRDLVTLRDDAPVPAPLDEFAVRNFEPDVLFPFLVAQSFEKLMARIIARHGGLVPEKLSPINLAPKSLSSESAASSTAATPSPLAPGAPDKVVYETVRTLEELDQWIADAWARGTVAVDTETTSLDAMQADLVGISLCVTAGHACYIPLAHVDPEVDPENDGGLNLTGATAPEQLKLTDALARLKPLFEAPGVLKILQNAKYDLLLLRRYDIRVAPIDDTMLLSYVLDAGSHGHGMDELSELHIGIKPIPFKEVTGTGKNKITFNRVPIDKATEYAAEDADITLRLHEILKPQLVAARKATVYQTLERPLVDVLVNMEQAGIAVDRQELSRLSGDFAQRMAALEDEIHGLAGRSFNIASPKQLGEVLFEDMGLQGGKKTKTGAYGTGADILENLAAEGHELPARMLDWRQLAKLKSTYTDALQNQINPQTKRIHTSYSMAATTTGRLASSDPNLQNIPIRTDEGRKIRRAFVAAPGNVLMSADYSQIELRLLAHIADIDALKSAFAEGMDIHAMTASEIFGVPVEGMDPMIRRQAKAINFGIIYGISPFGLARQLGISRGEAADYIATYFERFPGIRDYMDKTTEFCREEGFVETVFGRRCHMQGIRDKNPARRNFAERAAINAPIQGSAADIIRRAMIRMPDVLRTAGLDATMLLQVHDELVFELPEDQVDATRKVVCAAMENAALPALELSVPLTVDAGVGNNWDEAH